MGIEKFKDEAEEMKIPKKNFKNKVNDIVEKTIENNEAEIQTIGFNLFEIEEEEKAKKTGVTIYFKDEDLKLLKAISKHKNTTVNKMVMNVLEKTIVETKANLPKGFDIETMAEQYDEMNKDKGKKKGSNKGNKSKSKGKSK